MEDINIADKKWKYVDKQFCNEVLTLADRPEYEQNSDQYPKLTKLVERVEAMQSGICKSSCPSRFKKCKCYKSQNLTHDKTNDVFCGMVQDGFTFACPEICCTGGSGCSEPARKGEDASAYEQIPEGEIIELEDVLEDEVDSFKFEKWHALVLIPMIGASIFFGIIGFLIATGVLIFFIIIRYLLRQINEPKYVVKEK